MNIQNKRVATFHYKLKDDNGEVISASPEDNPLTYTHGTGAVIPGLEKALEGRIKGDEFSVTVPPEEAYGEKNPALFAVMKREALSGVDEIEPGMQFQAQDNKGNMQVITVTAVNEDSVTVDRNHPLAGMSLNFHVKVVDVKETGEGS